MASKKKKNGLFVNMLDMDRFIQINGMENSECSDPIFLNKNVPTVRGVLSYEIFGTSQNERRQRMGYINLHGHYMHPLAATKLASYDRTLSKVLYAQGRYKLVDGTLVEDPENGQAGPEFLYSIWGKVKVRDKDTVTTKEIQRFFEKSRDKLFITKFLVIPAFFRDINSQSSGSTKSTNILNSMYSSIISYTQTLDQYSDTFTNMTALTRGRVQTMLVNIYNELMVNTVKGQPSKFGMLRRSLHGKSVNYSARMVISAPVLRKESYQDVQVKFGHATVPLAYTVSSFFPFMVHHLKKFFDAEFIQGGKYPVMNKDGKVEYVSFSESFDENDITKMINRYINSPSSRFDKVITPRDQNGNRYYMTLTGRFNKQDTTVTRSATLTDILYIVAYRVVQDKHVFITRYPLDNYNGQFPARIEVASTTHTMPAQIGETYYQYFPISEGDPANAFVDTLQFSNPYCIAMGADYDGDTVSMKPVFTKEANAECERRLRSNAYVLDVQGKLMRNTEKDFLLCAYNLTAVTGDKSFLKDINSKPAKYAV